MMSCHGHKSTREPTVEACQRATPRMCLVGVDSNIGTVTDISRLGLRVLCRRVPPEEVLVILEQDDDAEPMAARVVWSVRRGFRKYEVGMQFLEPQADLKDKIWGGPIQARIQRVI